MRFNIKKKKAPSKVLIDNLPIQTIYDIYNSKEEYTEFNNYKIKTHDDRYLNFIKHGFECQKCGLKGTIVKLMCNRDYKNHFNVYGIDENNKQIMLTKDHIYPKSKGGLDNIKNYQVLCQKCNENKQDNSQMKLIFALREGLATKKSVENAIKQGHKKVLINV